MALAHVMIMSCIDCDVMRYIQGPHKLPSLDSHYARPLAKLHNFPVQWCLGSVIVCVHCSILLLKQERRSASAAIWAVYYSAAPTSISGTYSELRLISSLEIIKCPISHSYFFPPTLVSAGHD